MLTVEAHVFTIDQSGSGAPQWRPVTANAVPVQIFFNRQTDQYRIVSVSSGWRDPCMRRRPCFALKARQALLRKPRPAPGVRTEASVQRRLPCAPTPGQVHVHRPLRPFPAIGGRAA